MNWGNVICVLAVLTGVGAIVFKNQELSSLEKQSLSHNLSDKKLSGAQVIERGYRGIYEDNHNHGAVGPSAHSLFNYNQEGFEAFDSVQHLVPHAHHNEEPYLHHHYSHHFHKYQNHDEAAYQKAQTIKGLLVPLAGVALLGAAAALVSNPILLQLGVISGAPLGRRKREAKLNPTNQETDKEYLPDEARLSEIKLLERFMAEIPREELEAQEKKTMANMLSCSGILNDMFCLERLACELHSTEGVSMPTETNVLEIIAKKILDNDFVAEDKKIQISKAIERGRRNLGCLVYGCDALRESDFPKKTKRKSFGEEKSGGTK